MPLIRNKNADRRTTGLIVDQKHIHRTNCHEGLSATNAKDMACMFNKYFELSSNNNTGGSLAFVPVIMSSVVKITFVETKITF